MILNKLYLQPQFAVALKIWIQYAWIINMLQYYHKKKKPPVSSPTHCKWHFIPLKFSMVIISGNHYCCRNVVWVLEGQPRLWECHSLMLTDMFCSVLHEDWSSQSAARMKTSLSTSHFTESWRKGKITQKTSSHRGQRQRESLKRETVLNSS